jgi:hypothetical protein
MASPQVSTPSSTTSSNIAPNPPALAIKTANATNMAALAPASALPTPTIMTTKEWVIPPRPKPGRKPATDTPPTKRKAQNRAAQRAFRERRAARVGELEEQIEEIREEHQKEEIDLKAKVSQLEAEVQRFNGELQSWRLRCDTLDRIAEYERNKKESALAELWYLRNGARTTGTDAVPLPPRRNRYHDPSVLHPQQVFHTPTPEQSASLGCGDCASTGRCACAEQVMALSTAGCGKCSPDTQCACLDEAINAIQIPMPVDLKRAHSPSLDNEENEKRQRHSAPSTPLEVDFTAQFSSKPTITAQTQEPVNQNSSRRPIESCGFCEEGTYCMCAEAAAVAANAERGIENRLAPLLNEVTPPPSDTDVIDGNLNKVPPMHPSQMHREVQTKNATPTTTLTTSSNSCANGPGTCQQCQSDPRSGLFCRSLAAMRSSETPGAVPDGCCGGSSAVNGYFKRRTISTAAEPLLC